jgi:hypothetical protein
MVEFLPEADMVVMSQKFRSLVEGLIYRDVAVSITSLDEDSFEDTLVLERGVLHSLHVHRQSYLCGKHIS